MENEARININHEGGSANFEVHKDNSLSGYIDLQPGYEITIGIMPNGMSYQKIGTFGKGENVLEGLILDSEEKSNKDLPIIEFLDRNITVDMESGTIKQGEISTAHLTTTESKLLELLLEKPGHVVTMEEFSEALGYKKADGKNTMKVFMRRVRNKLLDTDSENQIFHNSRNRGYFTTANINRRAK